MPVKPKPFIKWVGGKRGLIEQILPFFHKDFNSYHEPFLGGGAVFFELYSRGILKDKKVYLSDINEELINSYIVVRDSPYELIELLSKYKNLHSKDFYYEIRDLDRYESYSNLSPIERATRFIYLNKTCFNGLYRVNKKGFFNTPMGSYKDPNIVDEENIYMVSEALQNVHIYCDNFEKVVDRASNHDLVYFDPPYYPLTKTSNFTSYDKNGFLEDEQKRLFNTVKELVKKGVKVVESNSDTDFIKDLYRDFDIYIVNANRFINSKGGKRGKICEVLIVI